MQCFCRLPCSTTSDGLLVCHRYSSSIRETVCLFTLHTVNILHFQNSTLPIACQCARCLATLSIAKRTSYENGVLVPFDHLHCHACGNFCTIKQSNKLNANHTRFYIVCASGRLNPTVQSNGMERPDACQKFFAWTDFLRTIPNRSIEQHINRIVAPLSNNGRGDIH